MNKINKILSFKSLIFDRGSGRCGFDRRLNLEKMRPMVVSRGRGGDSGAILKKLEME